MHVVEGLQGLTDLDLLFDGRQVEVVQEILGAHGFKRLPAHPSRRYPGVDDFFGVNEDTGRLLHLHLHYRLVVGERFFKNYRLPWEQEFLETRVRDPSSGVFVAEPALEWLLLACRSALKIRWRDRLRARITPHAGEARSMVGEHDWLTREADVASPAELATRLVGERAGELVHAALAHDLDIRHLKRLRRELLRNARVLRGYGRASALRFRWAREARWIAGTINRRYLHRPFPYSRSGSTGGTIVAVVGSDGAGKSTVSQMLTEWLSRKVDVLPIYFGSGQGRSSVLRWPLKLVLAIVRRRSTRPRLGPDARRDRDVTLPRAVWAVVLAREKRSKLRTAVRARERGFVVVCDRYPQTQVDGVNDGPLLWRWRESPTRLRRAVARWEASVYEAAAACGPDLVVRLLVTPETALARRPEDDPEELRYRTRLVRDLRFDSARSGVIDIDANRDVESVVLEVKRRVWPAI